MNREEMKSYAFDIAFFSAAERAAEYVLDSKYIDGNDTRVMILETKKELREFLEFLKEDKKSEILNYLIQAELDRFDKLVEVCNKKP